MPALSRAFKSIRKESLAGLAAIGLVIPSAAHAAPAATPRATTAPATAPAAASESVTILRPAAGNCAPVASTILTLMPSMLDTLTTMNTLEMSGKALTQFIANPANGFEICAVPGANVSNGIAYEPTQRRIGFGVYRNDDATAPNNIDRMGHNMRTLFTAYQQAQVSQAALTSLTAEDAAFAVALANASANAYQLMAMKEYSLAEPGTYNFFKHTSPEVKARSDAFDTIFDAAMKESEKSRKPLVQRQREALLLTARTMVALQVIGQDPYAVAAVGSTVQSVIIGMQNNGADRNAPGYAQHRQNVYEQLSGKGLGFDLSTLINDPNLMDALPEAMRAIYGVQTVQVPAPAVGGFKAPKR